MFIKRDYVERNDRDFIKNILLFDANNVQNYQKH